MAEAKITQARLRRGVARMGWTAWWLVDADGNLLNTEPVCSTPEDKWHPWFIEVLKGVTTPYLGVRESPPLNDGDTNERAKE